MHRRARPGQAFRLSCPGRIDTGFAQSNVGASAQICVIGLVPGGLRRRIHRQLNKGESLHALRRRIFFAFEGRIRRRHHPEQTEQALCLTLVTNAVVVLTTIGGISPGSFSEFPQF